MPAPRVTLVLGGARSGKSAFAESLALGAVADRRVYIATARAGDAEMAARIAAHRARRGDGWTTVEAPLGLVGAIRSADAPGTVALVDCLTLWLSNLMTADSDADAETACLVAGFGGLEGRLVLVSNELGLGIVPGNALARRFRDAHGRMNQAVAAAADRVVFVAAGLPLYLKGGP